MVNTVFYVREIGGAVFRASLSADGPYISVDNIGGVALGCCSIKYIESDFTYEEQEQSDPNLFPVSEWKGIGAKSWWIVKYSLEHRINIEPLSEEQRKELSDSFGIPIENQDLINSNNDLFYHSPAFEALKVWVSEHPKAAKNYKKHQSYLPNWYERALDKTVKRVH